jgi:sugar-specific transcriptional regulator TrmB
MKEKLKAFGFSEKEADTYVALNVLGLSRVTDIAKQAKINRSTAYVILGSLTEKGFVNVTEKNGVKRYTISSPKRLVAYLEHQARQYADFARDAKKLVPKLKVSQKKRVVETTHPRVQLFEGKEGIKNVYEDTLASLEGIRLSALKKEEYKISPATLDIQGKVPEISVYGDKIILVSPTEEFAAVVESKELAKEVKKILSSAKRAETQKKQSISSGRHRVIGESA